MQIEIREFLTFEDLKEKCWGGALFILNKIDELDNGEAVNCFMHIVEESLFSPDNLPDMTELNDFLRFDDKYIIEQMAECGYKIEK